MTAKKKPFSGRLWDRFSTAVGVAGNDKDSNGMFCDIPVPIESTSRSLCADTGADVTETVDDKGGARVVNLDASCWVEAFFLRPGHRYNGEQSQMTAPRATMLDRFVIIKTFTLTSNGERRTLFSSDTL